jgi:allophanate hydrolase subunit 1
VSAAPDELTWVGDGALRVAFDAHPDARARVRLSVTRLKATGLPGLRDVVPTAARLLLTFDLGALDERAAASLEARVRTTLAASGPVRCAPPPPSTPVRTVALCRCARCAPDLEHVARHAGLPPADVVRRHEAPTYTVDFLGFAPGFPYLAGLDATLVVPRRDVPRTRVPAGSVAIAGSQAGIYPRAMPGGWHLLGRTDLELFDARRDPPAAFAPGDRLRFASCAHAELELDPHHEPEPGAAR